MISHLVRFAALAAALLLSAFNSVAQTASVHGSMKFEGTPPEMPKIRITADPTCADARAGLPAPTRQDVIVNRNSTLKNVIVFVKSGLPAGQKYPLPSEPVVLDQRGCMYEPHVFAIRAGQELKILNS